MALHFLSVSLFHESENEKLNNEKLIFLDVTQNVLFTLQN